MKKKLFHKSSSQAETGKFFQSRGSFHKYQTNLEISLLYSMKGVIYGFSIFNNRHSRNTNLLRQLHLKFFRKRCKYSYYCENYVLKAWYTSQLLIEMLCEFGCWGSVWYFYHGKVWDYIVSKTFLVKIYRVSIKSFPDYKHLLQENYMEYKHIFFFFPNLTQLKMFVYNTLVHFNMCSFWCTENV